MGVDKSNYSNTYGAGLTGLEAQVPHVFLPPLRVNFIPSRVCKVDGNVGWNHQLSWGTERLKTDSDSNLLDQ